jgi:hypothetical protein
VLLLSGVVAGWLWVLLVTIVGCCCGLFVGGVGYYCRVLLQVVSGCFRVVLALVSCIYCILCASGTERSNGVI